MNDPKFVGPSAEAQRDVALAVLVLINDCDLTTDEALDTLVARDVISDRDREVFSRRYWAVSRFVRPSVDAINGARL